ncbi:DUF31 family protein [Ureaplasma miroungigenitalium]|uniref:DUF31 family protein n=1 Tax=Ureaplasma miroungigenitalium TaxID=1042321 RepID=UPI0021E849CC|nr:DUF31 family protein [Ureaplasma miroungigenitalium]MCV3734374.1 DUF31 family protein [Ureaplasma miroungigenitalium]
MKFKKKKIILTTLLAGTLLGASAGLLTACGFNLPKKEPSKPEETPDKKEVIKPEFPLTMQVESTLQYDYQQFKNWKIPVKVAYQDYFDLSQSSITAILKIDQKQMECPMTDDFINVPFSFLKKNTKYENVKISFVDSSHSPVAKDMNVNIQTPQINLFLKFNATKIIFDEPSKQWKLAAEINYPLFNNWSTKFKVELVDKTDPTKKIISSEIFCVKKQLLFNFDETLLQKDHQYILNNLSIIDHDRNEDTDFLFEQSYLLTTINNSPDKTIVQVEDAFLNYDEVKKQSTLQVQFANMADKYCYVALETFDSESQNKGRQLTEVFKIDEKGKAIVPFDYNPKLVYQIKNVVFLNNPEEINAPEIIQKINKGYTVEDGTNFNKNTPLKLVQKPINFNFTNWSSFKMNINNNIAVQTELLTDQEYEFAYELVYYNKENPGVKLKSNIYVPTDKNLKFILDKTNPQEHYQVSKVNIYLKGNLNHVWKTIDIDYSFSVDNSLLKEERATANVAYIKNVLHHDARSSIKFVHDRTFRIIYPDQFYELYPQTGEKNFLFNPRSFEAGTGWVLDKDLSDPEGLTYYIATNLHVIAHLRYPLVITNNTKVLANPNINARFLEEDDEGFLRDYYKNYNFNYSNKDRIPFSEIYKNKLAIYEPTNELNWNDILKFPNNNLPMNIFKKYANTYIQKGGQVDLASEIEEKTPISPIIDYEILDPYIFSYSYNNYYDKRNKEDQIMQKTVPNAGVDMAIVKVKLNPKLPKPKAFAEYDRLPTLFASLKTDDVNNHTEKIGLYGFSRVPEGDQVASYMGETKRYYNPDLFKWNDLFGEFRIKPEDREYVHGPSRPIHVPYNLHNTEAERANKQELVAAIDENNYYFYVDKNQANSYFHPGSSGSMVVNDNKEVVGIFYAAVQNKKNPYFLWQNIDYDKYYSPLAYYLKHRTNENSWLKQNLEAIRAGE